MYQQPAPQPRDEREWQSSSYIDHGSSPAYGEGYTGNPQYNDQLRKTVVFTTFESDEPAPVSTAWNSGVGRSTPEEPQLGNAWLSPLFR